MSNNSLTLGIVTETSGEPQVKALNETVKSLTETVKNFSVSADKAAGLAAQSLASAEKATASAGRAVRSLGDGFDHAVPRMAAASGAIREFEGSLPIRAVERFLSDTLNLGPALGKIFPLVGGIAFAGLLVKMGEEAVNFYKKWDPVHQAQQRAIDLAKDLDKEIKQLGDELQSLNFANLEKALGKGATDAFRAQSIQARIQGEATLLGATNSDIATYEARIKAGRQSHSQAYIMNLRVHDPQALAGPAGISATSELSRDGQAAQIDLAAAQKRKSDIELMLAVDKQKQTDLLTSSMEDQQGTTDQRNKKLSDDAAKASEKAKRSHDELTSQLAQARTADLTGIDAINSKTDALLAKLREEGQLNKVNAGIIEEIRQLEMERYDKQASASVSKHGAELMKEQETKAQESAKRMASLFDELDLMRDEADRKDEERRGHEAEAATRNARVISEASVKADVEDRKGGLSRQSKLIAAQASPGDELATLSKQIDLRRQAAQIDRDERQREIDAQAKDQQGILAAHPDQKLEVEAEYARLRAEEVTSQRAYERELGDERLDIEVEVASRRKKELEDFRTQIGGLFDAIASRQRNAIPNFLKSQVLNVAKTVTENAASQYIYPALSKAIPRSNSPLLKGTPFETVPKIDPAMAGNTSALTLQTSATENNTSALGDLYAAITGKGAPGIGGSAAAAVDIPGGGGLAAALAAAVSPSGAGGGLPSSVAISAASDEDDLPLHAGGTNWGLANSAMRPGGPLAGSVEGPLFDSSASMSSRVGSGMATAGAVIGGGIAAYQGFKKGGAQGSLQGISSITGTAAMLDPEPISKTVLAGVAMVTGLVAGILGDPKQKRENQINQELSSNAYNAPTALNASMDTSGNFADIGAHGELRTSTLRGIPQVTEPYTWEQTHGLFGGPPTYYQVPGGQTSPYSPWPSNPAPGPTVVVNHNYAPGAIQTMDQSSFHDFAQKNVNALADASATALQNSHSRLTSAVQSAQR